MPDLFRFAQLEFPWELGPADGRYVLRGHAGIPQHVLVLTTLGAVERRKRFGRRKGRDLAPEPDPVPVPTSRATLVWATPFASDAAARAWQTDLDAGAEAEAAVAVLNRVLHLQRTAAADPYVREITRGQAIAVRVGLGEGEQVAHGRWTEAVEVPPPVESRQARKVDTVLRPQERLAALLGGRDVALACEELILRARTDLDAGRTREAALQLRVGFEAALSELAPWADRHGMGERLGALREERSAVGAAANAAVLGGLDSQTAEDVERVVKAVEAALRQRTSLGLET